MGGATPPPHNQFNTRNSTWVLDLDQTGLGGLPMKGRDKGQRSPTAGDTPTLDINVASTEPHPTPDNTINAHAYQHAQKSN